MGGTSTDVSRYDGEYEHVFESTTAGVSIQAPQVSHSEIHSIQSIDVCLVYMYCSHSQDGTSRAGQIWE